MTFSDAEDEHHGTDNASNDRSPSRSRTESGVSNASTASLASPSPSPSSSNIPPTNGQAERSSSPPPSASSASASASAIPGASNVDIANAVNSLTGVDMKGVDSKKIVEKLQQVQGYIQQTTTAMATLEQQGDISKVGQYNTLVKVLRDLKDSEVKLKDQLDTAKRTEAAAAAQVTNGSSGSGPISTTHVNGQDDLTETSVGGGGGRVIGVVGSGNVRSLQDRLSASQVESVALMTHMRESIARREDLMTRYKATRERLANLKKQRMGIQEEKQRLLAAAGQGGGSSGGGGEEGEEVVEGEEDPIPGAARWSLQEITQAVVDFQELLNKVQRLTTVYNQKAQDSDPNNAEEQANISDKLRQLASKRRQLTDAVTRLKQFKLQKLQEAGQTDGDDAPTTNSTTPGQTPDTNNQSSHQPSQSSARDLSTSGGAGPSDSTTNIDIQNPSLASIGGASADLAEASNDLATRQNQLVSLQQQLSGMRQLLEVTSSAQREAEVRAKESKRRLELAKAAQQQGSTLNNGEEGAIGGGGGGTEEVLTMGGKKILLTEEERMNPEIASKYQQLAQAKDRLAKMEEVIQMISVAKRSGQNLREVMPADYLAILEDAETEMEDSPSVETRRSRPVPELPTPVRADENDDDEEENPRVSRRHSRGPRMGSVGRGERERERRAREQERSEISAMQKRLNKPTPRVPAINEGSRHGLEKGAIKKQPQALWQEGNQNKNSSSGVNRSGAGGGGSGIDPRVSEVLAMQEELRQKKNVLEALMRRMGKSSSLNADNISDNISEDSHRLREDEEEEEEVVGGMGATWGGSGMRDYSDDQFRQSSDDELIEEDEDSGDLLSHGLRRRAAPQQPQPPHGPTIKDRNRHTPSRHRRTRQDSAGRISVNNLSSNNYATAGRNKHNRLRSSSAPKAVWEGMEGNYKSPSNTTLQAHHSLNAALSQLTQVQGTINNLQESLRQEQSQVLGSGGGGVGGGVGHYYPTNAPLPHPLVLPSSELPTPSPAAPLAHLTTQALTPMSSYAGLGSLAMAGQVSGGDGRGEMSQQVLTGLQQCFSQLHLHSLEIQALSKHLQVRRPTPSLYYPPTPSILPPPPPSHLPLPPYYYYPPYQ